MNTPTVTLYSLPLYASLPLPIWVWLNLSGFIFYPSIGLSGFLLPPSLSVFFPSFPVVHSPLSAPDCESALLWQFCCRALLTCMSCCIAMSSPMARHHPIVLRVCAVLSPATWQCWTHAPSTLWPGLPKEPPQANSTFFFIIYAHSAPHTDGLSSIVLRDLNEAISVWSISLFSVLSLLIWVLWVNLILFAKKSHYHYTGSV